MKNNRSLSVAVPILVLAMSTKLSMADCDYLSQGSWCGGSNQTAVPGPPPFGNGCIEITYTVNGPSETCTAVGEYDCGFDACTQNKVLILQSIKKFTTSNYQCILPLIGQSLQNFGYCEQDSIPASANPCGDNCGSGN
jgi:hypothetical protein